MHKYLAKCYIGIKKVKMISFIKIKNSIKRIKHDFKHCIMKSDAEMSKKVQSLLLSVTPIKWAGLIIALMLLGLYLCEVTSYSLSLFLIVFIGLNSISTISLFSEHKFIKSIRQFEGELLGQSDSYNENVHVAALLAKYGKTWNISGDVLLKAMFTIIFFSIIGIGLLGKYPPNLMLAFFLLIFVLTVGISMIGYFQYEALYGFIIELPDIYKPSTERIFWLTQKRYSWIARLAQLYDFYSAVFFCLALIYSLGCFIFCFHEEFGVLSSQKSIIKIMLLMIFWCKILLELVFKFLYKLCLGKKKISLLESIIKDNCLDIIQHKFCDPILSEKDYEGFNLYLQLQQISIVPKTNWILDFVRAVSCVANSIVTFSSLYTLFAQAF